MDWPKKAIDGFGGILCQYRSQLDWLGTKENGDLSDEKLDDEIFSCYGLNLGDIFENVSEDQY